MMKSYANVSTSITYVPWTVMAAKMRYHDRWTYRRIAEALGKAPSSIASAFSQGEMPRRCIVTRTDQCRELIKNGVRPTEAAVRVGLHPKSGYRINRKMGLAAYRLVDIRWGEDARDMLVELWGGGFTAKECAEIIYQDLGETFTKNAIIGRVHRNGLQRGW